MLQESESEEDLLGEGDDDVEEEHDHEPEVPEHSEHVLSKALATSPAPKEAERQLSKKERRKKELAELEALLADFGVSQNEKVAEEPSGNMHMTFLVTLSWISCLPTPIPSP